MRTFTINFPKPDASLVEDVLSLIENTNMKDAENIAGKWNIAQPLLKPNLNSAFVYAVFNQEIHDKFMEQYKDIFNGYDVKLYLAVFKNINPENGLAFFQAHTDTKRDIVLNFVIDAGGSNVLTNFYNSTKPIVERDLLGLDSDLVLEKTVKFNQDTWVVMDTSIFHSVDNIEGTRLVLSVQINDLDYASFIQQNESILTELH